MGSIGAAWYVAAAAYTAYDSEKDRKEASQQRAKEETAASQVVKPLTENVTEAAGRQQQEARRRKGFKSTVITQKLGSPTSNAGSVLG